MKAQRRPQRGYLPRGPAPKKPVVPEGQLPAVVTSSGSGAADGEKAGGGAEARAQRTKDRLIQRGLLMFAGVAVLLPVLRAVRLVAWPWGVAFAPLTAIGLASVIASAWLSVRPRWQAYWVARRGLGDTTETPAPDALVAPEHADDADMAILTAHPELLAALCHGYRKLRLVPAVLGRPVTDPWSVYDAAVQASAIDLLQLRIIARRHVERFASRVTGRRPSEAQAMKRAVDAFRKCAERSLAGRIDPDCPFEHVVVVFGIESSPNRDAHLASMAPKVRVLLERQYPQLATAQLDDGSHVKYDEWNKQAALDRAELARLLRDQQRHAEAHDEALAQLTAARARIEALQDGAGATRREARAAARAEQERAIEELRATVERTHQEHTRQIQRLEGERERLTEAVDELTAERDMFQQLLFTGTDDEPAAPAETAGLAGLRVLLVGGEEGQVPPIRAHLEGHGIQLVQQDGASAADLVAGANLVVLWIRYVSHPTAFTIKRECRNRRVPLTYWSRTSPASLAALIADASAVHRRDPRAIGDWRLATETED